MKRKIIIFGASGSGKSTVLHRLSNYGYLCLDNLKPVATQGLQEFLRNTEEKVAMVVRTADLSATWEMLPDLDTWGKVFLDGQASDLVQRYHHDRQAHDDGYYGLQDLIVQEQQVLEGFRSSAHWVIDTSSYNRKKMLEYIDQLFGSDAQFTVSFISFGFRYGVMRDIDYLFDARFLENPYYYPHLAPQTGDDSEVYDFVHQQPDTQMFVQNIITVLDQVLLRFRQQNRQHVNIAIACSGGKHRSVSIVNYLFDHYSNQYHSLKFHRDIQKNKEEYS